jgi:hypothetical protein
MPCTYPALPESQDAQNDRELRARARQLADEIELAGAKIRVRSNDYEAKGVPCGAGFSNLADRLNCIVGKPRGCAENYPRPIPQGYRI